MRVVHQLISYFRAHGALSERQLEELRTGGFLLDDGEASASGANRDEVGEDASGQDRVSAFERDGETPGAMGPQKRGKPVGVDPLCRDIALLSKGWEHSLRSFVEIANHISSATSWHRSALIIRNADPDQLGYALNAGLSNQTVSLKALSGSLDVQDYRDILFQGPRRTKAMGAYRALLRTYDFSSLGKYAWILKHEQVNDVFNLIQAKRAILNALHDMFANQQEKLIARLRGNATTTLFWAFVVLRSAKAEDPWIESRRKSARSISYLDKLWPPQTALQRAGLYALFMDPDAVLSFLTSDFDVPEDARGNPPWIIPSAWTLASEKHYIKFQD